MPWSKRNKPVKIIFFISILNHFLLFYLISDKSEFEEKLSEDVKSISTLEELEADVLSQK